MNMTPETLREWARDCAPAAKAVLMARVHAQLERERVNAYVLPIFRSYGFRYSHKWADAKAGELIDNPDHLFCCDDEPQIAAYFAACDTAHRAHGFTGPQGHCPALVAEHLLIKTEHALIGLAHSLTGIDAIFGDDCKRYLELLIGACAPFMTREI